MWGRCFVELEGNGGGAVELEGDSGGARKGQEGWMELAWSWRRNE